MHVLIIHFVVCGWLFWILLLSEIQIWIHLMELIYAQILGNFGGCCWHNCFVFDTLAFASLSEFVDEDKGALESKGCRNCKGALAVVFTLERKGLWLRSFWFWIKVFLDMQICCEFRILNCVVWMKVIRYLEYVVYRTGFVFLYHLYSLIWSNPGSFFLQLYEVKLGF